MAWRYLVKPCGSSSCRLVASSADQLVKANFAPSPAPVSLCAAGSALNSVCPNSAYSTQPEANHAPQQAQPAQDGPPPDALDASTSTSQPSDPNKGFSALGIRTKGRSRTRSGYRESTAILEIENESSASADSQRPPKSQWAGLRVELPKSHKGLTPEGSGLLGTSAGLSNAQLDQEAAVVFSRLVGNLTKHGHKSKAQNIVLEAMKLMREELEQAKAKLASSAADAAAAATSSKQTKAAKSKKT